jgi:hypothetical protein
MIGPLDTATLARRLIIPFFRRERYDFMISEPKSFAYGQGLRYGFVDRDTSIYVYRKRWGIRNT